VSDRRGLRCGIEFGDISSSYNCIEDTWSNASQHIPSVPGSYSLGFDKWWNVTILWNVTHEQWRN